MGNVVNRVFESAGPEGKVRGTPQQIIEKYEQLARDSQTAGDRVTAENFLQHAEHYLRLLSAAQAEQQASQPQQQRDRNDGQQGRDGDDDQPYYQPQRGQNGGQSNGQGNQPNGQSNGNGGGQNGAGASYGGGALETIDAGDDADPLVATPEAESTPEPKAEPAAAEAQGDAPRPRAPRRRRPRRDKPTEGGEGGSGGDAPAGSPDPETVPG